jgi:protein-disulfide isomerase
MLSRTEMKIFTLKGIILFMLLAAIGSVHLQPAEQGAGKILGGSLDAPIRIEVFSDFECPGCRELYLDVMRRVVAEYSRQNKVCLIYHEFPLRTHQHSLEAARYAEAASRFGRDKLLGVYDALFMDQAKWSQDGKIEASVAKALSRAELQELKKIMRDPGIKAAIDQDIRLGVQKQVTQTPTFFIYAARREQKVEGRLSYISLKQFIDTH